MTFKFYFDESQCRLVILEKLVDLPEFGVMVYTFEPIGNRPG
jgi:hypothetical protein